jgi:formate hydrogenlyase transcriptional activator
MSDAAASAERIEPISELERHRALLEVSEAIALHRDLHELFHVLAGLLHPVVRFDSLILVLHDAERNLMRAHLLESRLDVEDVEGLELPLEESPGGSVWKSQQPAILTGEEMASRFPAVRASVLRYHVASACMLPLTTAQRRLGVLGLISAAPGAYNEGGLAFLTQVARQVALAVDNALAYRQIAQLKDQLAEEKVYLEDEIRTEHNFEEIVGDSEALTQVLKQVEIVAPTQSTVLILGETGTGKELIARAIHDLSGRRARTFVKVNCAAIPSGLLESELFGHERGAFTGAIAQKIGRFELAHHGTLFLDEIGDIPLELQPKLLRVLQEQEFERLGSTRTLRVDVRLVAATNQDLSQMVEEKKFRSDLFYRLNVFPISIPPLRERAEDIPTLVRYFVQRYSHRMDKRIETIPTEGMEALQRYRWPGNVRELENLIERAVILTQGSALYVPLAEIRAPATAPLGAAVTLQDAEREHILRILRETNWVVGGPLGAATQLGLKRTTLQTKMRKLGISRPS